MKRETIERDLETQASIEGQSADIPLLTWALGLVRTGDEWSALAAVEWHRYGTLSYQCHRFWRPSALLRALIAGAPEDSIAPAESISTAG